MLSLQTEKKQVKKTYSHTITTILVMFVIPVLLISCAWITQHPHIGALGFLLALFIMWLARNWIGTSIFLTAFAFVVFIGPTLSDLSMKTSGEKKTAIIVDVQQISYYSYDRFVFDSDCKLVTTEGKPIRYTLTETTGCWGKIKTGQKIEIVEDPSGWLPPIVATKLDGVLPRGIWLASIFGLLIEFQIFRARLKLRRRT